MIRVPRHVLNVAVQAHARIVECSYGRPSAVWKAAPEKAIDSSAGLPQARGIGDLNHSTVPKQFQRCVPLADSSRSHRLDAPPVLAVRGLQVQQSHEIGFRRLLYGVPARRFDAFFLHNTRFSTSDSTSAPPMLASLDFLAFPARRNGP